MKDILRKIKLFDVIRAILLVFFLGVLLYPTVSDYLGRIHSSKAITSYNDEVKGIDKATKNKMLKEAQEYNQSLVNTKLYDPFSTTGKPSEEYMNLLNVSSDGMMAYLQIPKIDVKLPIYHTTSEEVLSKAAGHLEGSSLPVGGKDTHAVISAHRGLPSATLFTDLDQVKKGDHFLVHVLNKTLCYEVDSIVETEPDDTSALAVQEGKDLVSLLTCTPYGVNTQRLIVTGHRVSYNKSVVNKENKNGFTSLHTNYLLWVIVGLSVTGGFIFILYKKDKKMRSKE